MLENITASGILFSFTPEVMETIKKSEYSPWEIACEISDQIEAQRNNTDCGPFVKISSFSINGQNITKIRLAYNGIPLADINPNIGLTLGKDANP